MAGLFVICGIRRFVLSLAPFFHGPLKNQFDLAVEAAEFLIGPLDKFIPEVLIDAQ
jgi:hypothetical protein